MPTDTLAPTEPPPPAPANVVISYIFYDGVVKRVESHEYAQITNQGGSPVILSGWHLNAGDSGQDFWFPGFEHQLGRSCRVYANEMHDDSCAARSARAARYGTMMATVGIFSMRRVHKSAITATNKERYLTMRDYKRPLSIANVVTLTARMGARSGPLRHDRAVRLGSYRRSNGINAPL